MLETHVTNEGRTLLIAQMDDNHLRNMIRLVLRAIKEVKAKSESADMDPYSAALYGIRSVDPQEAAEMNRAAICKLYPYLAEAFLRGMDDLRDEVVSVIGRDSALPGGTPSIPAKTGLGIIFDDDLYLDPSEEPF